MKTLSIVTLAFICLICNTQIFAQDKMFKIDGQAIDAKVKQVDTASVTNKQYDNQDGPIYILSKNEIRKIKYENGVVDRFDNSDPLLKSSYLRNAAAYGKNIISIIPFSGSTDAVQAGNGFGFSYERTLDKRGF